MVLVFLKDMRKKCNWFKKWDSQLLYRPAQDRMKKKEYIDLGKWSISTLRKEQAEYFGRANSKDYRNEESEAGFLF